VELGTANVAAPRVSPLERYRDNPGALPRNRPYRVRRSSGRVEEGWFVLVAHGLAVVLINREGAIKSVSMDAFLEHNAALLS
jgi:hypothetical protein